MENAINQMTQKNFLYNQKFNYEKSLLSSKNLEFCPCTKVNKMPLRIVPSRKNGNIILSCANINFSQLPLRHNKDKTKKIKKVDKNGHFFKIKSKTESIFMIFWNTVLIIFLFNGNYVPHLLTKT